MKRGILLGLLLVVLLAVPVAAASYTASITVTEDGTTGYDMLPVSVTVDNDGLADLNIMLSTGLDTRVLQGSTELPHMVVDDRLLFALPIAQGNQYPLEYTFGNTALTSFSVIVGDGGYVTVSDHANLELADDFEVEFDGRVGSFQGISDYPIVVGVATSTEDSATTSHTVDLYGGIERGDLLLLLFGAYGSGTSAVTITWDGDWTELDQDYYTNVNTGASGVAYRIADGAEGSAVTVTTSRNVWSAHQVYRIINYQGTPEISSVAENFNSNPNSASLSPSWGSDTTLWFSFTGGGSGAGHTVSSYPANYADGTFTISAAGSGSLAVARREYTGASEDPAQYTMSTNIFWDAYTVGIQGGEGAIQYKEDAFVIYRNSYDDIVANILGTTPRSVAGSLSDGQYIVNVWADSTDLGIDIDGSTEDSVALSGASVPDNTNDWLISPAGYMDYYTHTTSSTLRITYEPDDIISGTTLPNEENPGTYDGTITWGSNPANIATVLGALLPVETSAASATAEDTQASFVPDTGDTTWTAPGIEGENLPLYGFFKGLFTTYREQGGADISMPLFWKVVVMMTAWAFGTVVLITTKQVAFAFIAYVAGFAVPAYYMGGLLDSWIPIVYGIGAACLAALTWKWTSSSIA